MGFSFIPSFFLSLQHTLFTAIHKHYSVEEWKNFAANNPECVEVCMLFPVSVSNDTHICIEGIGLPPKYQTWLFSPASRRQLGQRRCRSGEAVCHFGSSPHPQVHLSGCGQRLLRVLCGVRQDGQREVSEAHHHGERHAVPLFWGCTVRRRLGANAVWLCRLATW